MPRYDYCLLDFEMLMQQQVDVVGQGAFIVASDWSRRVASTSIVRSDDTAPDLDSLSHILSELGVMESNYLFCGRLALVSFCITARQPQGYRITFQLRALAGFRLRSAK